MEKTLAEEWGIVERDGQSATVTRKRPALGGTAHVTAFRLGPDGDLKLLSSWSEKREGRASRRYWKRWAAGLEPEDGTLVMTRPNLDHATVLEPGVWRLFATQPAPIGLKAIGVMTWQCLTKETKKTGKPLAEVLATHPPLGDVAYLQPHEYVPYDEATYNRICALSKELVRIRREIVRLIHKTWGIPGKAQKPSIPVSGDGQRPGIPVSRNGQKPAGPPASEEETYEQVECAV